MKKTMMMKPMKKTKQAKDDDGKWYWVQCHGVREILIQTVAEVPKVWKLDS